MTDTPILNGVDLPERSVYAVKRKPRSGVNLLILKQLLEPGSIVYGIGFKKMRSIVVSAHNLGIKLRVRKIDDAPKRQALYAIQRINESPPVQTP